ncbi:hypothetical protein [Conyzicola sp.]|uniref:hypothetical protein n=1 Tax=Conyzicola sp. TaxID=1969404 RepID=UPI0039894FA9
MTRLSRTPPLIGLSLLAAAALAGCTPGALSSDPGPTPSATDDGSADLPIDVDDIPTWAAQAVPQAGDPGYVGGYSGWLSRQTSPALSSFASQLPAGDYTVTVACNGDSAIEVTLLADSNAQIATQAIDCAGATTRSFAATVPPAGFSTEITLDAEPVIYAIAFQAAL